MFHDFSLWILDLALHADNLLHISLSYAVLWSLSSKMLEIAISAKRIEESIVSDMTDFLKPSNNQDKFDLIVCGDALVYLGALEDVFNGVSHQLVDGGIFCFTVEHLIEGDFDLKITVKGGGSNGQAEAIRLAISRALCKINSEHRAELKPEGLLTRDPRMVERKKFGQKKARKKFQFSKR